MHTEVSSFVVAALRVSFRRVKKAVCTSPDEEGRLLTPQRSGASYGASSVFAARGLPREGFFGRAGGAALGGVGISRGGVRPEGVGIGWGDEFGYEGGGRGLEAQI